MSPGRPGADGSERHESGRTWEAAHREACARGDFSYTDPETGFLVFTRLEHLRRGFCCESGCRHCPYDEGGKPAGT